VPTDNRTRLICCAALAAITLAVYWPVRNFDFLNYDDPDYVTYNPAVQHGITPQAVKWAFTTGQASNWHPLTWISHMADCALYGLKPAGHHLTNLLFHTVNTVLLFLVLSQMTGALWRSALVAALFAWHPLHVESVAWVSERKDVLSAFFWLLTMMAYARYARWFEIQSIKSKVYYCLSLLCFALGLLSKPMVVTLPFVLLLLDFWPLRRICDLRFTIYEPREEAAGQTRLSVGWLVIEKIPFFILAAASCVVTFVVQKSGDSVVKSAALPFSDRVANALVSYVLYLWKTIWPQNLAAPYPYSHHWSFGIAAAAALLLLAVSIVVVWQIRGRPYLAVGWFWFLGTLVPVIGLVQVGLAARADRYTYLPLIGIFIMVAWSIPGRWAAWPSPGLVFGAVTTAVLIALLTCTETQLQYWRNSVALFSHSVEVTTGSILSEYNLAEALARQGDADDAIIHYQKAIAIHANPVEAQYNSQPQAHFNLGLIFSSQKKWAEAEAQFRTFLRDEPNEPQAHSALAEILKAEGRLDEAKKESQRAAQLRTGITNAPRGAMR
jgi:tetratricopeptide (TPR) repeat protein